MTPEKAAYAVHYADREFGRDSWGYRTVKDLADALEAVRAERDKGFDNLIAALKTERERAERAEASLTFERQANEKNCAELLVALAALARVRALCAEWPQDCEPLEIIAAIEGDNQ